MPTMRLLLETITAALSEQLGRNADTTTLISTVASFSTVIAQHGLNESVRAAANDLQLRVLALSRANYVPRWAVHDMLEDFVRQMESRSRESV